MILKFINPAFNAPHISTISDAFICKNVDDEGNITDDWVLMINATDEYYNSIMVTGAKFSELCEMINSLYDDQKLDITSDANLQVSVYPRGLDSMLGGVDGDVDLEDLFNGIDFDDED